jgi:small-conductance mechanosensitive channel
MSFALLEDARLRDVLVSLLLLASSYLVARIVSYLFGRAIKGAVRRTSSALDEGLLQAVQRPITYAVFVVGAYAAAQRLPLKERVANAVDDALFVFGVLFVTVALVRTFAVLLDWYTADTAGAPEAAREFGPLVSKIGTVFITLVALTTVLERFHVNVSSLVVSLGVGSLAVGLAAQDTLSNMFAGFTLLLDRPFRVGERIRLPSGEVGDVVGIGMRATTLKTLEEAVLIVPNSLLVKDRLTNLSRPSRALAASVELVVTYGADLDKVRSLLMEAAAGSDLLAPESKPSVSVRRFGEYGLHVAVGFQARDYASLDAARSDVAQRAHRALCQAGIEIAVAAPRGPAPPPS